MNQQILTVCWIIGGYNPNWIILSKFESKLGSLGIPSSRWNAHIWSTNIARGLSNL